MKFVTADLFDYPLNGLCIDTPDGPEPEKIRLNTDLVETIGPPEYIHETDPLAGRIICPVIFNSGRKLYLGGAWVCGQYEETLIGARSLAAVEPDIPDLDDIYLGES